MKQFRCGDVVLGCEWVTRSEDEQVLFAEIQSHARDAHGMDEVPPEVVDADPRRDHRGLGPDPRRGERAQLEEGLERLRVRPSSRPWSATHASL